MRSVYLFRSTSIPVLTLLVRPLRLLLLFLIVSNETIDFFIRDFNSFNNVAVCVLLFFPELLAFNSPLS